ncbi:MAG: LON peptidase substrate-binding domain-containing protein [Bacteroidota bacterium]
MTTFLPLFPLRLVAFPGEDLNLHIFEPRYKQLINECNEKGITFGMPAYIEDKLQPIGTELELVAIEKRHEDGEMDIRTKGKGLFKIKEFFKDVEDRMYSGAEVERIDFDLDGDFIKYEKILTQIAQLYEVLTIRKPLPPLDGEFNTYKIGHLVGLSIEQEYELLTIPEERRRQNFILSHLERLIPTARRMEELRKKVQMNGHFKNLLPPDLKSGNW